MDGVEAHQAVFPTRQGVHRIVEEADVQHQPVHAVHIRNAGLLVHRGQDGVRR